MATEPKLEDAQVANLEVSHHQPPASSSSSSSTSNAVIVNDDNRGVATDDDVVNASNGRVATDDDVVNASNRGVATENVKENGVEESENKDENSSSSSNVKENGVQESENKDENSSSSSNVKENGVQESENKDEENSSSSNVNNADDEEDSSNGEFYDLSEHEKKALSDLRSLLDEAILTNTLFKDHKEIKELDVVVKKENQTDDEKSKLEAEDHGESEKDVKLWGVSLLPSKGDEGTDTILIKFLSARDFNTDEAFKMLRNTLHWRKENKIDSILEEDFGTDYESVAYMSGVDREGHPVCYNVYGVFGNDEIYNKTFATEESLQRFLRWRLQMLEKEIQKLNFEPGGVSSLLQINDLKDTPGPARKDLRLAMNKAVALLQDNYPEFVARNIFINVPFWYYAFNAVLSPFLTQRTKDKFVFTRPARVTETLLKYIGAEAIPVHYGGLMLEYDPEFTTEDVVEEINIKAGATETIEIPIPEGGGIVIWDLIVHGWDVNYKEEFVPRNESSYIIIVSKGRRIGGEEESVRNSFRSEEPGKIVLTIENVSFKKKRILYRFKIKSSSAYFF